MINDKKKWKLILSNCIQQTLPKEARMHEWPIYGYYYFFQLISVDIDTGFGHESPKSDSVQRKLQDYVRETRKDSICTECFRADAAARTFAPS